MTTSDVHSLAGAYALDAVDDVERAQFERHLSSCHSCRAEVTEFLHTGARLGSLVEEPPPPWLRSQVIAAIDVTRQRSPAVSRSAERRRDGWPRAFTPLVAAAASVALTLVAVTGLRLLDDDPAGGTGVAAEPGPQGDADAGMVVEVLSQPDAQVVPLSAAGFRGTVVRAPSMGMAVIAVSGMSPPEGAEDGVYVLWAIRDGQPVRAGALDMQGMDVVVLDDPSTISAVAVSLEPRADMDAPSGPIMAQAQL